MSHERRDDEGKTDQFSGKRLWKDHPRIEALGVLDELNAFLGLARACLKREGARKIIAAIQRDIILISGEIATPERQLHRLKQRMDEARAGNLEKIWSTMEARAEKRESGFCIPGDSPAGAILHICRTQARRTERRLVSLKRKRLLSNPLLIRYLNRLSALLFLMAQEEERKPFIRRSGRSN